jgi:uncharacterized membrane protein
MSVIRNETSFTFTKISFTIFVLLICLYIAARFWHLTGSGLWFDEVFSVYVARLSWAELVARVAQDIVHPPLFYLLLKIWIGIGGHSLFWLRLFPALTAIAAVVPFLLLCRELKLSPAEINTALLLLGVNSYLIYYAQELRMYSLLLFFTLSSLWLFIRFISGKDNPKLPLTLLVIVNLLLIYTQYFGWLVIGTECVYVILWKRQQFFIFAIHIAALAFCFAPWAFMVIRVAQKHGLAGNLGWLQRPRLADLIWYFALLHGSFDVPRTTSLGLIIFGCPLLLWTWGVLKRENKAHLTAFWLLILSSLLPVVLAFLASQILPQSVWSERYLIISAVPYLILVAVAAHRLPSAWGRIIFSLLIIAWAAASGVYALSRDDKKLHWEVLTHTMMQAEPTQAKSVRVYTFEEWAASPIKYSLESSGDRRFDVVVVKDVTDLRGTHFWVAFRNTTWRAESLPQDIIRGAGCQVRQEVRTSDPTQTITLFSTECPR